MKKRKENLIIFLIGIPIICIWLIIIGVVFNIVKVATHIVITMIIAAVLIKTIMTIIAIFKSYAQK